jgi:hypothetical protein
MIDPYKLTEECMSRKRKSDKESTETPIATETTTAVAEPPVPEANASGQGFADRVEQRKRVAIPDPFPVAKDYLAGVELFHSKLDSQMAIKFGDGSSKDKPSPAILEKMREAGWKWKSQDGIWALPFTLESEMRTHIEAERHYQDVCKMIRQEKGIAAAAEVPF